MAYIVNNGEGTRRLSVLKVLFTILFGGDGPWLIFSGSAKMNEKGLISGFLPEETDSVFKVFFPTFSDIYF